MTLELSPTRHNIHTGARHADVPTTYVAVPGTEGYLQKAELEFGFFGEFVAGPRRFPDEVDVGGVDFVELFDAGADFAGQGAGHRARWGCERHGDLGVFRVGVDFNVVDQAEVVDVHGNLGVEHTA